MDAEARKNPLVGVAQLPPLVGGVVAGCAARRDRDRGGWAPPPSTRWSRHGDQHRGRDGVLPSVRGSRRCRRGHGAQRSDLRAAPRATGLGEGSAPGRVRREPGRVRRAPPAEPARTRAAGRRRRGSLRASFTTGLVLGERGTAVAVAVMPRRGDGRGRASRRRARSRVVAGLDDVLAATASSPRPRVPAARRRATHRILSLAGGAALFAVGGPARAGRTFGAAPGGAELCPAPRSRLMAASSLLGVARRGLRLGAAMVTGTPLPFTMTFILTHRCNFRCDYCDIPDAAGDEMTREDFAAPSTSSPASASRGRASAAARPCPARRARHHPARAVARPLDVLNSNAWLAGKRIDDLGGGARSGW